MNSQSIKRNVIVMLAIFGLSLNGHTRAAALEPTTAPENLDYQPSANLELTDLSVAAQESVDDVLLKPDNTLKSYTEINNTLKTSVIDPRFGQINAPLQRINAAGVREAAPANINLSGARQAITQVSASNPSMLVIPTISEIIEAVLPSVVEPTAANGGLISGSRLSMAITPKSNPFSEIPVMTSTTRSTQDSLKLNIHASCFPTNLRAVDNPIRPNATLKLKGKYSIVGSPSIAAQNFEVSFPASAVMLGTGGVNAALSSSSINFAGFPNPSSITAGVAGNLISINLPSVSNSSLDVNTGTIQQAHSSFQISDLQFTQTVPAPTDAEIASMTSFATYQAAAAAYLAQTGVAYWLPFADWQTTVLAQINMVVPNAEISVGYNPASQFYNAANAAAAMNVSQSADGKVISLSASLPGNAELCGGFYSPLMVFFDKDRPQFENVTDFKMTHDKKTYWPEKNHAGYFLGLLNANGKIESHKDLFGESENVANGFESLAKHDSNKDGIIDSKDAVFKKLVLWKDKAGLGKFSKKDIVYAHKKLKSIQLKYKNNFEMASIGAEYRQRSTFDFIQNGKSKKGEIVDVWFKPYLKLDRQMASK